MDPLPFTFDHLYHGGDYNPEQWPEAVWDDDVRLMQLAHVNIATLPVFGWVHLEPEEGVYTFEWLDRVIGKLHDNGVGLCLATATASVPAWMDRKYPDILRVDKDGHRLPHGNRHSFCPNSPSFRRLSTALAGKIAERYAGHPGLQVWHVGNEYGETCYCEQCEAAFRDWLKARYGGSLNDLNGRWYTAFWGHTYTDWEQVEPPTSLGERSVPALSIDYARFQSQSLLNCFVAERDAIRVYSAGVPITTNLMGAFKPLDYRTWAAEMDLVSWDSYPQRGATPAEIAFSHSLMRGLKAGQPWMLMEQTPSQQNWQAYNSLKRPGVARLWSYQALAHGADAIMYFQWRRGRGGIEKLHGAVVEHAGRADARVFQEIAALGAELEALGTATLGGRVQSDAAVLFDWENWWAVDYCSGPSVDMKYVPQVQRFYSALHEAGYAADVAAFDADLSPYKLVVAPVLYMVKPGVAERLRAFVEGGGTLVVSYFSGIADETDTVFSGGYPGPLADILGIWVEEIDALPPSEHNEVRFEGGIQSGMRASCSLFFERVHPKGDTQVVAAYTRDFYAGEPAVTVNSLGAGRAYYVATVIAEDGLREMLRAVAAVAGASLPLPGVLPKNVEVTARVNPSGDKLIYVLNHNSAAVSVPLGDRSCFDHLSGKSVDAELTLGGYGVAILAENSPSAAE